MTTKIFNVLSLAALMLALLANQTAHAQQSEVGGKALGYRVRDNIREAAVMDKSMSNFYGALRVTVIANGKVAKVEFVRRDKSRYESTSAEDIAVGELVYKNAPIAVRGGATPMEEDVRVLTHILSKAK